MMSGDVSLPLRLLRRAAAYPFLFLLSLLSWLTGRPVLVVVVPFGDLGNRLFLYANIVAFAMEHDAIVLNPAFHPWRKVFAGTRPGALACYPPPPLPFLPGGLIESIAQQLAWVGASIARARSANSASKWASIELKGIDRIELDHPGFVHWARQKHVIFLSGWLFVSTESMHTQANSLRAYFRQVLGLDQGARAQLESLRNSCDLLVGVLIRHGDYRYFMGGKYFYETSTYIRWMRETVALFPDRKVGFFITGNDDRVPEGIDDLVYKFGSHSSLGTRYVLSQCDYILSPVGTYAGWAAFSGDVPLLILSSPTVPIRRESFRPIYNHIDMRDPSFPPDLDRTGELLATPRQGRSNPRPPA